MVNTLGINYNTHEGTKEKSSELTSKISDLITSKKVRLGNSNKKLADEFQQNINTFEDVLIRNIIFCAQIKDIDLSRLRMKLNGEPKYSRLKGDISNGHRYLKEFYEEVEGEKNRLLELDLIVKRRFLRYRIYTAIGIALVVFGLVALSHYTGISLALSSIKKVSG